MDYQPEWQQPANSDPHRLLSAGSRAISTQSQSADFIVAADSASFLHERNASPSRGSIHSVSSNVTTSTNNPTVGTSSVPHLKHKHGHKHMRHQPRASVSAGDATSSYPTVSTISSTPAANNTRSPSRSTSPTKSSNVQLSRSNTAPSPRRAPASHSSYGVETTIGPPPSFDTRRTYAPERVWKADRSKSLRVNLGVERVEAQHQVSASESDRAITAKATPLATPQLTNSSPDTADTQSITTPTDAEESFIMDARSEQGLGLSHSEGGSKASSESHKSEDLFLHIARVDATRPSSSKGDRRKSRISLPFLSGTRPATSHTSDSAHLQSESSGGTPREEIPAYHSKRSSLQFGQLRGLETASEENASGGQSQGLYSHRSSGLYADTIRPVQRNSTLTVRNNRLVSESGYVDRARTTEQNATESTASTNAPSTVWDELDDLKSRIRKLELTGKLPPSSAAAMSTAERPRTATTAATTMSTSPKHNKIPSQLQSTVEGIPSTNHPLLHEALGNAKTVVSHDVFLKLQSTAQDALQLASLTNSDTPATRNAVSAANDRQIRRRTESLCRSLTELAIALAAETKPTDAAVRPPSREYISPSMTLRSRRYSQSNENRDRPPVSMRVQSRLDNRRTSAQFGSLTTSHTAPELESPTALPPYPQITGRSTRVSGAYRNRRPQAYLDGATDEEEASPGIRPVSRAQTDVNVLRRPSRDHTALSREYTNQHPMPPTIDTTAANRTPLPSNLSTNFISRRKHQSPINQAGPADSSPLAPRPSWGRISVVHQDSAPHSDTVSEAPGATRSVSTRRSFGLAGRIGSSVGNRLRAARTERIDSRSYKESPQALGDERGSVLYSAQPHQ